MGARQGFGINTDVFDESVKMRSLIVALTASDNDRVITSIHAGYGVISAASNAFEAGRLLIVQGTFLNQQASIDPHLVTVPVEVGSVIYDFLFDLKTKIIDFGSRGFLVSGSQSVSVILTAPATATDVFPLHANMNGFLNVQGYEVGKDQPFEKLR